MKKIFQKPAGLKIDLKKALKKILKPKKSKPAEQNKPDPEVNELEKIEDWFPHEEF